MILQAMQYSQSINQEETIKQVQARAPKLQTIDLNLSVICCKLSGINIITGLCKTNVLLDTPSQTIKRADIISIQ